MQADRLSKKHTKAVKKALKKKAKPKKEKPKKSATKKAKPQKNTISKKLEKKVRKICKPSENRTTIEVHLESPASETFRCQMAANSLDIDIKKKLSHHLKIEDVDLDGEFNIGLVIGASGSGKTTMAKKVFGDDVFTSKVNPSLPIIDQFPEEMEYDDCANLLSGIGLSSVPCWIRPVYTLSNGQRSRAEAALILADSGDNLNVIDEWTSVVDRTVAKVMSHCVQKRVRQYDKKLVLLSCHYDVVDWLDPDWIIDCNTQTFTDRRSLRLEERERKEKLTFDIREIDNSSWPSFAKYHYLSDRVPGGKTYFYGIFHGENQIGFQCYANYCPMRPGQLPIFHSNRVVIHPDYAGMGLGIHLINSTSELMKAKYEGKVRIMAAFSSVPLYRARIRDEKWVLRNVSRPIGNKSNPGLAMDRQSGFRTNVRMFSFEYVGTK